MDYENFSLFKIMFIADPKINLHRFFNEVDNSLINNFKDTIGSDIRIITLRSNSSLLKFIIWDLNTNKDWWNFWRFLFKGASGVIVIFDLTDFYFFYEQIPLLLDQIFKIYSNIPVLLVGLNSDISVPHQVHQYDISQLCKIFPHIAYLELKSSEHFDLPFKTIAHLIKPKTPAHEFQIIDTFFFHTSPKPVDSNLKKQRLSELTSILKELNFSVNDNSEVEIITHRGFFTINIRNNNVYFSPINCDECKVHCDNFKSNIKKHICIVANSYGWSNTNLSNYELTTLSKIVAISEDKLPKHVLDQISKICPKYSPQNSQPPNPTPNNPDLHHFSPQEAKTLLRNYKNMYLSGKISYSLFSALKARFKKILNDKIET